MLDKAFGGDRPHYGHHTRFSPFVTRYRFDIFEQQHAKKLFVFGDWKDRSAMNGKNIIDKMQKVRLRFYGKRQLHYVRDCYVLRRSNLFYDPGGGVVKK